LKLPRLPAFHFGREDGQVVILVVVGMSIFLFAALGLAIDGGQMYAQRQMAQAAADAAAQAGIMSILRGTNITSSNPFGTGVTPIASSVCTTTDLRTPCVYARYNGFGGTAADTVTLSFPTSVAGVNLSSATVPAFAVTVQRTLQTSLIRFIGPSTSSVTAKATAALVNAVSPDSIIVLSTTSPPNAANALDISNGATLNITGGAIAVNSNNADAATITGGATVTAAAINVVGGDSINNGGTSTPTPVTGAAAVADPLASLAALTPGACLQTNYSAPSNTVIPAGTYCGGITVTNGVTNVTFGSGNFIINGGGLTFGGGITTSGSNLMFYLTGTNVTYASVTIANGVTVTFTAPTSGTYQGILFYQNRSITSASNATFAGGANMNLSGTLYFPTTNVSFSNGVAAESNSTAIVANEVSIAGGANLKYDPTGQKTGLFLSSVALVQ
jgi:Flp pilus assembly protein TadG